MLPRAAMKGVAAKDIAAIGITNQRETTVLWDRATGEPLHNAIVWQDRRTAERCRALKAQGHEARGRGDDRASARSVFLRHQGCNGCSITFRARARAQNAGELAFGTIDSWLIYKLTGGRVHATDVTNASRTHAAQSEDAGMGR